MDFSTDRRWRSTSSHPDRPAEESTGSWRTTCRGRPQREIVAVAAIPSTNASRTLLDLAGLLGERSLRAAVERAAAAGQLDTAAIERSLATSRRRGAPLLRAIAEAWTPVGAPRLRSVLEARVLMLLAEAGLPEPSCNQTIAADEKCFEVDFIWPSEMLVLEADGRGLHHNPVSFERDRERDRALQICGYRVVRVTAAQVARDPDGITTALRRLLARDSPSSR